MAVSHKDCKCTSCGDDIKISDKITIKTSKNKPPELLCWRCNPESEVAKVRVPISGKEIVGPTSKHHARKPRFFRQAK